MLTRRTGTRVVAAGSRCASCFARCCSSLALTALGAAVVYATVHGSLPPLDGKRAVAGPTGEVAIERDALGVVTIIGRSRTDVAFATGFAHAQDRFFQMDLGRRMAAGRLSELFGDAALDTDVRNPSPSASPPWPPTCSSPSRPPSERCSKPMQPA